MTTKHSITPEEIEGNRIIGRVCGRHKMWEDPATWHYHKDPIWQFEVLHQIEQLGNDTNLNYTVGIGYSCKIVTDEGKSTKAGVYSSREEAIFKALVEFAQQHIKTPRTQENLHL